MFVTRSRDLCLVSKLAFTISLLVVLMLPLQLVAQAPVAAPQGEEKPPPAPAKEELSPAPEKVEITPLARDEEISDRLQRVLEATEWFTDPEVRVEEGVVFLSGTARSEDLKKWAGDLARNTQDVVAVANRMEVLKTSAWDFSPAWAGVADLWREFKASLPFALLGLIILALAMFAGIASTRASRPILENRIRTKLLLAVAARSIGVLVFLVGAYIVLRVTGMTQLALSIIGGTGLVGLAVGIAFRDITENFLASIFLSMQRPFENGDLVEVDGITGYVQQLNIRTTVMMTFEGNLVQIPNATVYKSNLRNFTTNANRREEIVIGIAYGDSLDEAQEIALKVLTEHPAVLNDPEPMVLADAFLPIAVNLKIYYWINGKDHSVLKVRSSIIRLLKAELQRQRILLYPVGFPPPPPPAAPPIQDLDGNLTPAPAPSSTIEIALDGSPMVEKGPVVAKAEAGLKSDAEIIEGQAKNAPLLKEQENLLKSPPQAASEESAPQEEPASKA